MSIVKITDKNQLDELVAKITMRLGRRPTQQKVLDYCVQIAYTHLDEIITLLHPIPKLDNDKWNSIQKMRKKLAKLEWEEPDPSKFLSKDDKDLYGGN